MYRNGYSWGRYRRGDAKGRKTRTYCLHCDIAYMNLPVCSRMRTYPHVRECENLYEHTFMLVNARPRRNTILEGKSSILHQIGLSPHHAPSLVRFTGSGIRGADTVGGTLLSRSVSYLVSLRLCCVVLSGFWCVLGSDTLRITYDNLKCTRATHNILNYTKSDICQSPTYA